MWTKKDWAGRVQEFLASDEKMSAKYSWPFPMGVFGTLRIRQGNHRRMTAGKFNNHRVGFLPHYFAEGLRVGFEKNACAPFEVFFYDDQKEWNKMIPGVDSLEGFWPDDAHKKYEYGYFRTLVWIHLLPEGTVNEWFPESRSADLWNKRDMKIDPKTWDSYEKVPAWVYSNQHGNKMLTEAVGKSYTPLIWPKVQVEEYATTEA